MQHAGVVAAKPKSSTMKPASPASLRAAMRTVAALKAAAPFNRQLRDDLEYEECTAWLKIMF